MTLRPTCLITKYLVSYYQALVFQCTDDGMKNWQSQSNSLRQATHSTSGPSAVYTHSYSWSSAP